MSLAGDAVLSPRAVSQDVGDTHHRFWEKAAIAESAFAASMDREGPFEEKPLLAVAVSGGADSLALTLLADHWAKARGGSVVGLTVDHGLRSGSAEEALQTGRWLAARNIEHHILQWSGKKPLTGLQRHAREARYALLGDWCQQRHCLHLLTAHHRQDQAETVAIRKARQSGDAGLAAMPAVRHMPHLRLLRPLLGVDKDNLKAYLRANSQPWLTDPSNDDPRFTRNRLRQEGLDIRAMAAEAESQGQKRRKTDRRAALALVQYVIIDPAGYATLDPSGFDQLPHDAALDLLTRLLVTIGGRPYPPRQQALLNLFGQMRACGLKPNSCWTLSHCGIRMHHSHWLIYRDNTISDITHLKQDRPECWDNRFLIRAKKPCTDLTIKALGKGTAVKDVLTMTKKNSRKLPGLIKASLPAVWQGDKLIAIPHLGLYASLYLPEDFDLRFYPSIPLANAPFRPHIRP